MEFNLPKKRQQVRQIQTTKRNVPLEQIIAVGGYNPLAQGIEVSGNVIGSTLTKRAELRREGEQLAKLEQLSGQQPGAYQGLNPSTAQAVTLQNLRNNQQDAISPERQTALDLRKQQMEALALERKDRREQQINKDILLYSESLEKNPIAKKIREQGIGVDQLSEMTAIAAAGNTVASSAMGVKAAKAMGEVGVLTESDIKRYVQSGRLDRAAADTLSRWINGRPTEATINEIGQISNVLRDSFDEKIQPIHNTYVERLSRNYNLTPEESAYRLAVNYKPTQKLPTLEIPKPKGLPVLTGEKKSLAEKLGL